MAEVISGVGSGQVAGTGRGVGRRLRPTTKLLPADTRHHNRSLLLQHLYRDGPSSRSDLARATGLTRVTVTDLVGDLLADGLVRELGLRAETRPGKPATLVGLDDDARSIVVVDLSDVDDVRGALVDLRGRRRRRVSVSLDGRRGDAALALVADLVRDLVAASDVPVLAVGVGTSGVVDGDGVVQEAPHLGWSHLPLRAELARAVPVPVYVANDANAAALAEHTFGGAQDGGLMVVIVGHGVGAGLLLDGALVLGHGFAAGEIGHVVVDEDGEPCVCGRTGCLETILAEPALRARASRPAAGAGHVEAVLADAGERLGQALAPVISVLNVREVVLRGPADLLDGALLHSTVAVLRRRTMPIVGDDLDVRLSALGEDGVLLGAASLVLSHELGIG